MSRTRGATADVNWPQRFYCRADDLQDAANIILTLIFLLLVSGGIVFYLAPQITLGDLGANNIGVRIESATKRLAFDRATLETAQKDQEDTVVSLTGSLIASISQYTNSKTLPVFDTTPVAGSISLSNIFRHDMNLKAEILKLVSGTTRDEYPVNIKFGADVTSAIMMSKKDWEGLANIINEKISQMNTAPLVALKSRSNALLDAVQHTTETLAALRSIQIQHEISGTDLGSVDDLGKTSIVKLIQTNITRFGALAILSFLVAILIPLYRYNKKLAVYYTARGDALQMRLDNISDTEFISLANALTPVFDFGKLPQTPVEQIIELVKAGAGSKSEPPTPG